MAFHCIDKYVIVVYDLNGTSMSTPILTSSATYTIAIDTSGRLILNSFNSLVIYY